MGWAEKKVVEAAAKRTLHEQACMHAAEKLSRAVSAWQEYSTTGNGERVVAANHEFKRLTERPY